MIDSFNICRCVALCARLAAVSLVIVVSVAGCRQKEPDMPAVATPSVTFSRDRVALGSPVKVTYRFQVAQAAKFERDYWVFVHVLNPQGELLWNDDHLPAPPTTQWKPGQTIEYTRNVFVPNYPYIGEANVRIGLYSQADGQRLVLSAPEASRREYTVAKLELLPQSENIFLIYKDGWHPAEVDAANPNSEWQWTQKRAAFSFRNPKKDVSFYLEYDARTDLFTPPQQVTIKVGDSVLTTLAADSRDRKLLIIPITAAQLGNGDMVEKTIELDKTFKPGGADPRELGFRVYHTFIEPK
jgi:hypothetical protein